MVEDHTRFPRACLERLEAVTDVARWRQIAALLLLLKIVIIIGRLAPARPCDPLAEKFMRRYLLERDAAATTQFDFRGSGDETVKRPAAAVGASRRAVPVRRRVRSRIAVDCSRPIGYGGSASVGALACLAIRKESDHRSAVWVVPNTQPVDVIAISSPRRRLARRLTEKAP